MPQVIVMRTTNGDTADAVGVKIEVYRNDALTYTLETGTSQLTASFAIGDKFSFKTIDSCDKKFSKYCTPKCTATSTSNPFNGTIISELGTMYIWQVDRSLDPISLLLCKLGLPMISLPKARSVTSGRWESNGMKL